MPRSERADLTNIARVVYKIPGLFSIETIHKKTGIPKSAVARCLRILVDKGYLRNSGSFYEVINNLKG